MGSRTGGLVVLVLWITRQVKGPRRRCCGGVRFQTRRRVVSASVVVLRRRSMIMVRRRRLVILPEPRIVVPDGTWSYDGPFPWW